MCFSFSTVTVQLKVSIYHLNLYIILNQYIIYLFESFWDTSTCDVTLSIYTSTVIVAVEVFAGRGHTVFNIN